MNKLILKSDLCPGDILTMTAAVESLHRAYPDQYITDVHTSVPEIWAHNPLITKLAEQDPEVTTLNLEYPSVNRSCQEHVSFLSGYTTNLGDQLGIPLRLKVNRPYLYLSDEEKEWMNQIQEHRSNGRDIPFWLINAGIKSDYTAKAWPIEYYQEVVNRTIGDIQWVQVGSEEHDHPPLDRVIDLRGQTDHRQLIRLVYHCDGGLGPVTYLQHLCAAWEKPYICLLGGREPVTWVSYPLQHTLHTIGMLPCCRTEACWRSQVVPGGKDLCEWPILGLERPVAKCMAMIKPAEVLQILERCS